MEQETKLRLQEIMAALEKIQQEINELKFERDKLLQEFKENLPADTIMKIVK